MIIVEILDMLIGMLGILLSLGFLLIVMSFLTYQLLKYIFKRRQDKDEQSNK